MTEKKQLREQMALHAYKQQEPAMARSLNKEYLEIPRSNAVGGRDKSGPYGAQERGSEEQREPVRTLQRVVTIPPSDPSMAWNTFAQRQAQRRRARAKPKKYVKLASRTYVQTGTWASSGRMKAIRRDVSHYVSSPIPARSGGSAGHVGLRGGQRIGQRVKRRSFWWRLLGIFALTVALALGANFALTSSAFRIEQVNVAGTHNDALIHTIQSMGMQGQNIFLLNVAMLTERIEAFPLVATATLSKQWPNQLLVTVAERIPVILWQTPRGTYSVDDQGVLVAPLSETAGADRLGTVVDVTGQHQGRTGAQLHPGMRLSQADIAFTRTIFDRFSQVTGVTAFKLEYDGTMYAGITNQPLGQGSRGAYRVESPDGWVAYLGGANDANPLDNKLIELREILSLAKKQQFNLATIDLRYGLRPVYTVKQ